ncbi:MAG TPA: MATE family efflux transporter [Bryobacteraceae bacterium]|jgi:MATE family multidrug resistance protein
MEQPSELRAVARLAAPIVLAELGWAGMGLVDTMVVGRVSSEAMAAVGLGAVVFYGVGMCASGLLLGLDTLVSQAFGAGDREDCHRSLVNGVWLALLLIPIVMAAVWAFNPLLPLFGIRPDVLHATWPYLHALIWSTPGLLLYLALRRYLQGIHAVAPVMWTLLTANLINLAGNWVLVFGHLGAPALGAAGSGWATCFSRIYMASILAAVVLRRDPGVRQASWRPDAKRLRQLLRLGAPAAGQIAWEVGVFEVATILVARLSAAQLASHQIALAVVSTTYMMPVGISSAAAVRVGFGLGRADSRAAARSGWAALALGAIAMSLAGLTLLSAPAWIARTFTSQPEVIAQAMVLLRISACFQLFDGLQVVATGALRGSGDTHTPMLCHFAGYWLVGLPLGSALCFWRGMGAAGLWTGLSAGLILIGIMLTFLWSRAARAFPVLK